MFDVVPDKYTSGTSYDYYRNFPMFDEELYYILECATRQNAEPEDLMNSCRELKAERDALLLQRFENTRRPDELEIDLEEFKYDRQ